MNYPHRDHRCMNLKNIFVSEKRHSPRSLDSPGPVKQTRGERCRDSGDPCGRGISTGRRPGRNLLGCGLWEMIYILIWEVLPWESASVKVHSAAHLGGRGSFTP